MGVGLARVLSPGAISDGSAVGAGPLGGNPVAFVLGLSVASPLVNGLVFSTLSPARGSLLFSASFKAKSEAILPLGSTATKLVLTLERGLELSLVTLSAGDLPREGGDVFSPFCSNLARKEATPVLGDLLDMTI